MPRQIIYLLGFCLILIVSGCSRSGAETDMVAAAPGGISLPEGYQDWPVIAVSHRTDNNSLRAILGNEIAIKAARSGQTNPWPEGSILGKLVWKDTVHEDDWPKATVPGAFVHAEFMFKNTEKYPQTGGWGFARWRGEEQIPYGEDESFAQECFACHTPMKDRDYVFTRPAKLP
ncbi:putative cytochrome P460 [hydrothermal vent metagenome]|uniref:Putative cytochrome P460 n=1 Tax=hydrothermal vent metagenome TaxID=652676 RepID=A0A3B0RFQ6_9ZZZZ